MDSEAGLRSTSKSACFGFRKFRETCAKQAETCNLRENADAAAQNGSLH